MEAQRKQELALKAKGISSEEGLSKISYLRINLGEYHLGLSDTDYVHLQERTDVIVHNAWKDDFNLSLESYENPYLQSIRHLVDFSLSSPNSPRIVFISSTSSVMSNSTNQIQPAAIPSAPISNLSAAFAVGYAASKLVAERILTLASQHSKIPVTILRVAQIGGPRANDGSVWPKQQWLFSLLRTSKTLGVIPTHVATIDWLPVDDTAARIVDAITASPASSPTLDVRNVVNPHPQPWSLLLETLTRRFGYPDRTLPLTEWVARIKREESTGADLPALKMLPSFEALGAGVEDVTYETGASETEGVSATGLEMWLTRWEI
ncbi:hypothetical protein MMC16_005894 [Acarospora aff. strigata]|nr:hypothetical protein [Acarospora aff. strigata]